MEQENPQPEANKRVRSKNNQATVLKQLSNQSLYPLQERIGIYVIAILSTVGIVLITYAGVMALISTVIADDNGSSNDAGIGIEMDLGGIDDILGEVSDALDGDDYDDESQFQQDESDLHQYVDADDENTEPVPGVINASDVEFWGFPGSGTLIGWLQANHEIMILDLEYDDYWTHIETYIEFESGPVPMSGFVERQFVTVD